MSKPSVSEDFCSAGLAFSVGLLVLQLPGLFGLDLFAPIGLVLRLLGFIAFGVAGWMLRSMLREATGRDVIGGIAKAVFQLLGFALGLAVKRG